MFRSKLLLLTGVSAYAFAQTAPQTYTVTQFNAMFGPPGVTMVISRDGSKALIEMSRAPDAANPKGSHTRSLYNLSAHSNLTWDLNSPAGGCGKATFSGDWGDPFAMSAEVKQPGMKETGSETIGGVSTTVFEGAEKGVSLKAWIDPKTGLLMKAQMAQGGGAPQTIIEVKQVSYAKPAAALFEVPPGCAADAAAPPPPTEAERIAAATGGNAADFTSAITPPQSRGNSCSVNVRVVHAGSMQPITNVQLALDTTYDIDHPPHYVTGLSTEGKATYSGGGIRELTSQIRNGVLHIENPPDHFYLAAQFGKAGSAEGLIYRHCYAPSSVLLLVVKNPDRLSDGADWLWVKSGKYSK